MESGPGSWVIVALVFSIVSLLLAAVAYWRSGGKADVEAVRRKQQLVLDQVSRRIRIGLDDSIARTRRARQHLAELKSEAATSVHESIDALSRELADIERDANAARDELTAEVTAEAEAVQEGLAKRVRHIEGGVRVLAARAEIHAAEGLADVGEFADAERLLEDAVARVREAKMRLSDDDGGDDAAFAPVIDALHEAILAVRARAEDHKRSIDSVLAASDSLLVSLRAREPVGAAAAEE